MGIQRGCDRRIGLSTVFSRLRDRRWLALAGLAVMLAGSPTKAATISSWTFDPSQNQLDFTTDSEVRPRVQFITNPSRVVIDLPGILLGQPRIEQPIGSAVQNIRLGQFNAFTTRIVIELAPGYTLDPAQVTVRGDTPTHWVVRLPGPQTNLPDRPISQLPPTGQSITVAASGRRSPPTLKAAFDGLVALKAPMTALRQQVTSLMAQYSFLETGMFFVDLETGQYLDIDGDRPFPAASTIKLPILIAFFQDLDAGKVSLDETLVMRNDLVTGGSGDMQDYPVGSQFSARETVTKMITISDNTATNMIIDRLGGIARLNARFQSWGLQDTVIRNWLGDFRGTNTTSSLDMVRLLAMLENDKLLSSSSKAEALDLLRHTTIRTLLPAGLGPGADIADKTGDIGFLIGDAGLITMPSGRRYLAGIYVIRPYDDPRGRDFIRQVSQLVYSYLDQPTLRSAATSP